ncbi:MAG: primosomal protein N' [Bacteroidota bacterium]
MLYFLDVILPLPLARKFTYSLSSKEAGRVKRGMRVAVPFGKSKIYTGIAYQTHHHAPVAYKAKEIHEILDDSPVVQEVQLEHWEWIAAYYMCTLGEVVRAALPSQLLLESETQIVSDDLAGVDQEELTDDAFLIVEALHYQSSLRIQDAMAIVGKKRILPLVNGLVQKGVIRLKEEIREKYKPKFIKYLKLHPKYELEAALEPLLERLQRAPKQHKAVLHYFSLWGQHRKPIKLAEFEKKSGASKAVIKALLEKAIFEQYQLQADRIEFEPGQKRVKDIQLNDLQEKALQDIHVCFKNNKVCLLHGVTASGKTELYITLIQEVLNRGQQVLYLLPEIALTAQLIGRLKAYFGNQVAVYHSRYTANERVEVWRNVGQESEKARVIIGARSAVFLPFVNLGLVIIDEEHEQSYKQFDPAPRYHARDAAIVLSNLHKANCLLGSATPSIESYNNAKTGKYGLAEIPKRYGEVLMPEIVLVDLKTAQRKKQMQGHFSQYLLATIAETLAEKEQIILFQNRRGFAPILECTTCGHAAQCPNCDVSLTYHQHKQQLRCHYCGYHIPLVSHCQACGNTTLDTKGFGTEQIQLELLELFPEAKVARMDLDTTRGKYAYDKLITAFEAKEIDILVGTQMVTKGLDFRNVGLVGVMNADTLLNFPDYRAHERSFQMMVQVAGRAGRTKKRGSVLIQTYNPYHSILQQVSTYDYSRFFDDEIYEREQFHYPPHLKIIRITLKDRDFNKLNEASDWFATSLRNVVHAQVLGPEYPVISRIRNQYLKHILIKLKGGSSIGNAKNSIKRVERSFDAISKFRSVAVIYNVDHI